jgi:translation initiation factor 5A
VKKPALTCVQEFLNLMDGDGNAKDDVKLPDTDIGTEIQKAFKEDKDLLVTIIAAMGECFSYQNIPARPQP